MNEPSYAIPGTRIIGAKLSVGTTLRVHGWVMLKNLDEIAFDFGPSHGSLAL